MPPKKPLSKSRVSRSVSLDDVPAADRIPLLLYRRIALTFAVLAAALLLIVVYLSTMQAVIRVRPVQTTLTSDFIAQAVEIPVADTDVAGVIQSGVMGKTITVQASGTGAIQIEDFAEGMVTVHNDLSSPQPLVVRTRLLSEDGTQVRLLEGVTVPAKGTVDVRVRADVKGLSGFAPHRLTIPGLSEAKQQLVYATNESPFEGGVRELRVVTQQEIDEAVTSLSQTLLEDAKSMLRAQLEKPFSGEAFFTDVIKQETTIEPNTQAEAFDLTLEINVTGVFFDQEALAHIAERKLYEQLGQGNEFVAIHTEQMQVTVDKFSTEDHSASLRTSLSGQSITARTSKALDLDRFLGLSEEEVRQLLLKGEVATEVDVEFFPFWVKTVPRLKDHVYIKINENE